ncbi:MAG: aspartate aminotransferase family protein [Gammaproteobacteria bacterium]
MSYTKETALEQLAEFERSAVQALATFRSHAEESTRGEGRATGWAPINEILESLKVDHWIDSGGMDEHSFDEFLQQFMQYTVKFRDPRYIAHQVSVPDYPSALAALINGVSNNPMGIYEMGSAAATLEYAVINWMLRKVGWPEQVLTAQPDEPPTAGGVMTHGGSLANLTALLAARARIAPQAWKEGVPGDLAVLVPANSHYSNARAISILGLGSDAVYTLEVDDFGVVRPDRLDDALSRVRKDKRRCMALIANSCSTATGLHDPLRLIGEFCNEHNIWFHADACHGASALMSPSLKHHLDGIELADSIVWDTHKMMQVPVLSAAVLLRDVNDFDRAFHQEASYLAYGKGAENYDTITRTVECTRSGMAFKVFLNLAWRGEFALGEYVRERYLATQQFYDLIRQRKDFSCPYRPETNILCFRYGHDDALQERIRDHLMRSGQFHITSAVINNKRYLRLTVMNRLTDESTITSLLDAIESTARELQD